MTYASLLYSIIVLAAALALAIVPRIKWWTLALAFATIAGSFYMSDASPLVLGLIALLMIGRVLVFKLNWRYRTFAAYAVGSFAFLIGLAMGNAYVGIRHYQELRDSVPVEPLVKRLRPLEATGQSKQLTVAASNNLAVLSTYMLRNERSQALAMLHHRTLETFIKSPGFGKERRPRVQPDAQIIDLPELAKPIRQPQSYTESTQPEIDFDSPPSAPQADLAKLHLAGVVDFVNPLGFGYVTPDKQLFGFQPHHFRKLPRTEGWKVRSIELVSLEPIPKPLLRDRS